MCAATGISIKTITALNSRREKGLLPETVDTIANFFGVTPEYIALGQKEKAPARTGEGSIIYDKFSQLDEADQAYILGQIDALLSKRQ